MAPPPRVSLTSPFSSAIVPCRTLFSSHIDLRSSKAHHHSDSLLAANNSFPIRKIPQLKQSTVSTILLIFNTSSGLNAITTEGNA